MRTITELCALEVLAFETGLRHDALQAEFEKRLAANAQPVEDKPSHTTTIVSLTKTGVARLEADLFGERHVKDEDPDGMPYSALTSDVFTAYQNLDLLGKPWPSKFDSEQHTLRVQAELDRMLIA